MHYATSARFGCTGRLLETQKNLMDRSGEKLDLAQNKKHHELQQNDQLEKSWDKPAL
jgi:hypothetical protein